MQQNLAGHYCMETIVETIEIYGWTIIHLGRKLLKLQADNMIQILEQMRLHLLQTTNLHSYVFCSFLFRILWFGIFNCNLGQVISLMFHKT